MSDGKFFGDMVGFSFSWAVVDGGDTSHMFSTHGSVLRRMHTFDFMRSASIAYALVACIIRVYTPFGKH